MKSFEDYCWRDILTEDMERIYSAYQRERSVAPRTALVIIHPSADFKPKIGLNWIEQINLLAAYHRDRGQAVVHSVPKLSTPLAEINRKSTDLICSRPCESAFMFSELEPFLTKTDSTGVIVCGAPTSGAVRATAVEAKSFGYKTAIPEDAVADSASLLHKTALFDVAHKYADVMQSEELIVLMSHGN